MFIQYTGDLVLDVDTSDVSETAYVAKTTELYTIDDIAVDTSNNMYYARVDGDTTLFTSRNPEVLLITEIPISKTIRYFSNPEYGNPTSIKQHYKYRIREKISNEIGDPYDLLADLARKITMTERLCVSLADELFNLNITPDTKTKYGTLIAAYKQYLVAYNGTMDVADLENPAELFLKLLNRSVQITQVVEQEYKNKLV